MTAMRILTVRQPWAWAIFHGKDVENRVRNIAGSYRGPVAIHAGLDLSAVASPEAEIIPRLIGYRPLLFPKNQRGHIIGVVDLVDVHAVGNHYEAIGAGCYQWTEGACCPPWGFRYGQRGTKVHLKLANPRPLSEPIPHRGGQGLRWVSPELQARIEAAL